jgi:DNA repair protein RecO (recombination protein O)
MEQRTTGLVLRTRALTETSLIVHWLTADLGRLSTVAKGARRAKSPFLGKLDLFYVADFSFIRSRHGDLHTLREVRVLEYHRPLRRDLAYLNQASYLTLLLEQVTETNTPLTEFFTLLTATLALIADAPVGPLPVFAFELHLLAELGLAPDWRQARLSPGARSILEALASQDLAVSVTLSPTGAEIQEMDQHLREFLVYHLGRVPKGRQHALG